MDNTPFNALSAFDQTARLDNFVRQAYFRRSRNLPANISDIVACLKSDILKAMPRVPIGTIDDAITTATLDNDQPLSVAFFFQAVKRQYGGRVNTHYWDDSRPSRPDTEEDILSLLDTLAVFKAMGRMVFFNPREEFEILVKRGQLEENMWERYKDRGESAIIAEKAKDGKVGAMLKPSDGDVETAAKRLAVLDWLQSCIEKNITPSSLIKNTKK